MVSATLIKTPLTLLEYSWRNSYRQQEWTQLSEFKFWTRLFAFLNIRNLKNHLVKKTSSLKERKDLIYDRNINKVIKISEGYKIYFLMKWKRSWRVKSREKQILRQWEKERAFIERQKKEGRREKKNRWKEKTRKKEGNKLKGKQIIE